MTGSVQEEKAGSPGFSACIAECMGMQEEWQFVGCIQLKTYCMCEAFKTSKFLFANLYIRNLKLWRKRAVLAIEV